MSPSRTRILRKGYLVGIPIPSLDRRGRPLKLAEIES